MNGNSKSTPEQSYLKPRITTNMQDGSHINSSPVESNNAKHLLLSEILDRKVQTQSGVKIGRLKDLVFIDIPKYAEVTNLLVGRSFGYPPLSVPWVNVIDIGKNGTIVSDPPDGKYAEVKYPEDQLLLRGKILDKKILDLDGFDVEVVYDIQLLLVEKKLFIIGADVSRNALMRRLGLGFLAKNVLENPSKEDVIPYRYVQPLGANLTDTKGDVKLTITKQGLRDIHHEDAADILEELNRDDRIHVFNALDSKTAADALEATEPRVQREILAEVSIERVTKIFSHMSPVGIAQIISILPLDDAEEFQKILQPEIAAKVHKIVTQHDVRASALAMPRFLGFRGDMTVEEAFKQFREQARNSDVTMYIYVVDNEQHLKGVIDINELLQANPDNKLGEIMTRNVVAVSPVTTRAKVEDLFRRYRFRAIPMVDNRRRILGVIREKGVFSLEE